MPRSGERPPRADRCREDSRRSGNPEHRRRFRRQNRNILPPPGEPPATGVNRSPTKKRLPGWGAASLYPRGRSITAARASAARAILPAGASALADQAPVVPATAALAAALPAPARPLPEAAADRTCPCKPSQPALSPRPTPCRLQTGCTPPESSRRSRAREPRGRTGRNAHSSSLPAVSIERWGEDRETIPAYPRAVHRFRSLAYFGLKVRAT